MPKQRTKRLPAVDGKRARGADHYNRKKIAVSFMPDIFSAVDAVAAHFNISFSEAAQRIITLAIQNDDVIAKLMEGQDGRPPED